MVFCTNCGTQLEEGVKFCTSCGKPVVTASVPSGQTAASSPPIPANVKTEGLSEKIKSLIETAVADGDLEEKEISFLRRKAEELGDDPDEVEMTAKAEHAKVKKQTVKPASEKTGNLRKCPACGTPVESFQTRCSSCGHEFTNTNVSSTMQEFVKKINKLDVQIVTDRREAEKDQFTTIIIVSIFSMFIPFIVWLLMKIFSRGPKLLPAEQEKRSLIENFVIPNNREDIMEFILFSSSKLETTLNTSNKSRNDKYLANMWVKVWSDKCKNIQERGSVVLAGDTKTLKILDNLMEKSSQVSKSAALKKKQSLVALGAVAGVLIVAALFFAAYFLGIGVLVPGSAEVPLNAVTMTGVLDGYYKVIGDGLVMKSREGGTEASVTLELETVESMMPEIEKQIADFIQSKGWKQRDCTFYLSYARLNINGFSSYGADFEINSAEVKSMLSALLKKQPGETQKINLVLTTPTDLAVMSTRKKTVAKLMRMEDFQFGFDLVYRIENQALDKSEAIGIK